MGQLKRGPFAAVSSSCMKLAMLVVFLRLTVWLFVGVFNQRRTHVKS